MTVFRGAGILAGLLFVLVFFSAQAQSRPIEWGLTVGGGGAQAMLNSTVQPWAIGIEGRLGLDLRLDNRWRLALTGGWRRFWNDTTTSATLKLPDPEKAASRVWTSVAVNLGIRRLFSMSGRVIPYLQAGGGLTTWEVADYESGQAIQVLDGDGDLVDFSASEWHAMAGTGVEINLARSTILRLGADFYFLTGAGTDFAETVDDWRSRGNLVVSFALATYFGRSHSTIHHTHEDDLPPVLAADQREKDTAQITTSMEQPNIYGRGDDDHDGVPNRDDECPDTPTGLRVDDRGCPSDADSDGIADVYDRCAFTPENAPVDSIGCPLDSDMDGVIDLFDTCAATPEGALVDAEGCPKDTDGDGIFDGLDQCPDTPEKFLAVVDAHGCSEDNDNDGIVDWLDNCPDSPAEANVDSTGCVPDADADGIPDRVDMCPNTPSGLAVDETGCLVMTQLDRKLLLFPDFEAGYVNLDRVSKGILNDLAIRLADNPDISVFIRGYTDNIGEDEANQEISQRRADAARQYLIDRGISPNRVHAIGLGEIDYIASNETAAGRKRNRRLEFTFEYSDRSNTLIGDQ